MKDPLDLPLRKRIYDHIRLNPGVHFRVIQRDLGLAVGQLDFHVNAMVRGEVIVKEIETGNARFYVRDRFSREEKKALSVLRREIPRGIVLFLLDRPGASPSEILEAFKITNATLSYHLRKLEKSGILKAETEGRSRHYDITDPALMESLLLLYRSSLFDRVVQKIS